jgi:hypothetical protein
MNSVTITQNNNQITSQKTDNVVTVTQTPHQIEITEENVSLEITKSDNSVSIQQANTTLEFTEIKNQVTVASVGVQGPQGEQGIQGVQGIQGIQGEPGADGADGADGVGVPTGGTTGQALTKSSATDYDTAWSDVVPVAGGSNTEIQFNNAGAFDGVTELTWDDATKILQLLDSNMRFYVSGSGDDYIEIDAPNKRILFREGGVANNYISYNNGAFTITSNSCTFTGQVNIGFPFRIISYGLTNADLQFTTEGATAAGIEAWRDGNDFNAHLILQKIAYNVGIGPFNPSLPAAKLHVKPHNSSERVAIFQGISGQSANLTEWRDSLGVASATVTADGKFGNRQGYTGAQAFGHGATVTGNYATVIGENTTASQYGAAIGYNASAVDRGTAFGQTTSVTGIYGTALGNQATAAGSAVAVGYVANAAQDALAIGYGSATARLGISLGYQANSGVASTETSGIAIGGYTVAPGNGVAIGANSSVTGTRGIAIGARAVTSGANSIAIGYDADAVGSTSTTIGYFATADADGVGLGRQTNAGVEGTAIGSTAVAANQATSVGEAAGLNGSGQYSVAIGRLAKTSINSVAIGHQADATGNQRNVAIGTGASVTSEDGIAIGYNVSAGGLSVVIGSGASGSTSIGVQSNSATASTAVGQGAQAVNRDATSVGYNSYSGRQCVAVGHSAYALGTSEQPAMALGVRANVNAFNSSAVGPECKATAAYQFVGGGTGTYTKRTNVYFGNGVTNAAPEGYTINGTSATSGSNANGGNVTLKAGTGDGTGTNGLIILANLPTSDPGVTGALWNDGGTLKVS